ncbi:heme lyase CcmF/NrfE family subunit [Acetobacteraceae bacterium]|nr:heme lyase CcmF/NrfE family subunit [Acetobacteraceae bacterium]
MNFFFSLLNPETGLFALILAICFWFSQALIAFLGFLFPQEKSLIPTFKGIALAGMVSIVTAMLTLLVAFGHNDFSLQLVTENSESSAPLLYRLAGSWGNHNGSLLLWLCLLGICNYVAVKNLSYLKDTALSQISFLILGLVTGGLGLFSLLTSNPFCRLFPAPSEGSGLNPLLLDPGLACHPPLLYSGYVAFCVPFALTISALFNGKMSEELLLALRKWALIGWSLLSGGILLGAWWAYGTLGWGGYWFWDPVENASLMPWLTATALLHASAVSVSQKRMICWSFALSLTSFILSLMATFFVRSGIMNSVHSFAANPEKGEGILLLLSLTIIGGFGLFALRSPLFKDQKKAIPLISTENAIVLNNILLCAMMVTVLTGTLYPPLSQFIAGHILSVGKPFFDQTILPMAWPLLLLMGIAFFLPLKEEVTLAAFLRKISLPALSSLIALPFIYAMGMNIAGDLFFFAAIWMILGSFQSLYATFFSAKQNEPFLNRLKKKSKLFYAITAHIGVGIAVLGLSGLTASQGDVVSLAEGENVTIGHDRWQLDSVTKISASDYQGVKAHLSIWKDQKKCAILTPERRFYRRQRQAISTPAIKHQFFQDRYAVLSTLSQEKGETKYLLKLRTHPLGSWFWIGGLIAVLAVVFAHLRPIWFTPFSKSSL